MKKKDLKLNCCPVCKVVPRLRRVESVEIPKGSLSGEKFYVIECHGFSHMIRVRHLRKESVVDLWNTINLGEE